MVKKEGSLLIEFLFSLFILCLFVNITGNIFMRLNDVTLTNNSDIAYGLYSLTKEINTSNSIEVNNDYLTIFQDNHIYNFTLHNHRLVKRPGYDIYLHHIDYLKFDHDDNYVYMDIEREGNNARFIIGVYKRPSKRFCEPIGDNNVSSNINDDCIDGINDQ